MKRDRSWLEELEAAVTNWAAKNVDEVTDVTSETVTVPSGDFDVVYQSGRVHVADLSGRVCAEFSYSPHDRVRPAAARSVKLDSAAVRELCVGLDPLES